MLLVFEATVVFQVGILDFLIKIAIKINQNKINTSSLLSE